MTSPSRHPSPVARRLSLLVLTLLAGAFLRLWQITSIPPGLHYDLAATALLGNDVAFGGYRPVFIEAFTGHEVLFYYWLAGWFRLIGSSVFSLRLAAAMLGILAIACAYFAVRQVTFADRRSRPVALLAAVLLASAFFHVTFSRFGFRVIAEPVTQALALGFLWRGLRRTTHDRRGYMDFALGGAFTGLTAYTYLAARLFPFPIAIALLAWLWFLHRSPVNAEKVVGRARGLLLFLLTAALVFAPLGAYFYRHPETLLIRATQLAPREGESDLLLYGIRRTAEMVFISGEPYDRYNLPGRPLFGPVLGVALVLGLAVTLRRLWREHGPLARAAEVLLLAWLPLMLVPSAVAVHDIFPSNIRAFGVIPLIFVFPARGLLAASEWVLRRVHAAAMDSDGHEREFRGLPNYTASLRPSIVASFTAATLLLTAISTADTYFRVWANLPSQYLNNEADLAESARWLNARDTSGETVYVSSYHYRHPTLAYLARDYSRLRSIYQARALPITGSGPSVYVFPRSAPPPDEWLSGWEPFLVASPAGPDGVANFLAYHFPNPAQVPQPSFEVTYANFGYIAELTGFALRGATIGGEAVVDLRWRVLNPPETGDFRAVLDWVDAWGHRWSQGFNDAFPSEQWTGGETLITRVPVPLPAGLPPGDYTLSITLFSPNTGQTLSALDKNGAFAGPTALAGPVRLDLGTSVDPTASVTPEVSLDLDLGPLALLGFDPPVESARPGERLNFALHWRADRALEGDYRARLMLASESGLLVLADSNPVHGSFPTSGWGAGRIVTDRYSLQLPRDLSPGEYRLTLDLLPPEGPGLPGPELARVSVPALERAFDRPVVTHSVTAEFGELFRLEGYSLDPDPPMAGQPFALTLHWQSLAETERDYIAFVHLLDSSGALVAQHDASPRDGAYATSLWAQDEYVSDSHTFTLPEGRYSLAVGFYSSQDGENLGREVVGEFSVTVDQ